MSIQRLLLEDITVHLAESYLSTSVFIPVLPTIVLLKSTLHRAAVAVVLWP